MANWTPHKYKPLDDPTNTSRLYRDSLARALGETDLGPALGGRRRGSKHHCGAYASAGPLSSIRRSAERQGPRRNWPGSALFSIERPAAWRNSFAAVLQRTDRCQLGDGLCWNEQVVKRFGLWHNPPAQPFTRGNQITQTVPALARPGQKHAGAAQTWRDPVAGRAWRPAGARHRLSWRARGARC